MKESEKIQKVDLSNQESKKSRKHFLWSFIIQNNYEKYSKGAQGCCISRDKLWKTFEKLNLIKLMLIYLSHKVKNRKIFVVDGCNLTKKMIFWKLNDFDGNFYNYE